MKIALNPELKNPGLNAGVAWGAWQYSQEYSLHGRRLTYLELYLAKCLSPKGVLRHIELLGAAPERTTPHKPSANARVIRPRVRPPQ